MSGGIEEMFREQQEEVSKHYKETTVEPITVIESWGLDFNLGNVVKYIGRAPYKGHYKQDLNKALYYLQRAVDNTP